MRYCRLVLIPFLLLALAACGPEAKTPRAELDTPGHHVASGNKLLRAGKLEAAYREFFRAVELDPKYAPGYTGMALTHGLTGDPATGLDVLDKADRYAKSSEDELAVHVASMRLWLMGGPDMDRNWLKRVKSGFKRAVKIDPESGAAHYFMGLGFKNALQFDEAAERFAEAVRIDREYARKADREFALIQRIRRAMPGTDAGRRIAVSESITRADLCALFIQELRIDERFADKSGPTYDTAFKSPGEKPAAPEPAPMMPADAGDHVLSADIRAVLDLGVRGLETFPDGGFHPDEPVSRAEFSLIVLDVLIRLTGDESLATQHIGEKSPFPDLRNDLPFFNAAVVCVTRGILPVADPQTGAFHPAGPVSGADALLGVRALKNQL